MLYRFSRWLVRFIYYYIIWIFLFGGLFAFFSWLPVFPFIDLVFKTRITVFFTYYLIIILIFLAFPLSAYQIYLDDSKEKREKIIKEWENAIEPISTSHPFPTIQEYETLDAILLQNHLDPKKRMGPAAFDLNYVANTKRKKHYP